MSDPDWGRPCCYASQLHIHNPAVHIPPRFKTHTHIFLPLQQDYSHVKWDWRDLVSTRSLFTLLHITQVSFRSALMATTSCSKRYECNWVDKISHNFSHYISHTFAQTHANRAAKTRLTFPTVGPWWSACQVVLACCIISPETERKEKREWRAPPSFPPT